MLWYAARGAGANYLAEMAEALYQESGLALEIAARLWKIGASSGRHLLAGVLLGNELFNTREGSKISLQEKIIRQIQYLCRFCDADGPITKASTARWGISGYGWNGDTAQFGSITGP